MATTGVNDPFSTDLFFLVLIIKLFLQYKSLTDVHTSGNRGLSEAFTCGVRLSGAEVEEGQTIEQEGESSEEDL